MFQQYILPVLFNRLAVTPRLRFPNLFMPACGDPGLSQDPPNILGSNKRVPQFLFTFTQY